MVIPREAKRITYSSEIRALKKKSFSKEQLSIVQGALLGDGCLHTAWAGTSKNYRFAKTHSVKQKEYVNWTYAKLKPFILTPPALYEPVQSLKLRTISHPELTQLRSIFYPNGKKILPNNLALIMQDSLALAVWFMDDGSRCRASDVYLNTQQFAQKDQKVLQAMLAKLQIENSLNKDKKYSRIRIKKSSIPKLYEIISPYIIPSMTYKLGYDPVETCS